MYTQGNSTIVQKIVRTTMVLIALSAIASATALPAQTHVESCREETISPTTLLVQLQSDRFKDRQSAMYRIMRDPEPVIPFIEMAFENADADFRKRALRMLSNLADYSTAKNCRSEIDSIQSKNLARLAFETIERICFSENRVAARQAEDAKFQVLLHRQYLAARFLERLNARVSYSEATGRNGIPIAMSVTINKSWGGTRHDLELVGELFAASRMELTHEQVDDDVVGMLSSVHGLTSLKLSRCSITDESIQHLSNVGTLNDLELLYCPIGLECFSKLAGLDRLESIRLIGTSVEPNQMSDLKQRLATAKVDIRRGAFMGIRYSPTSSRCMLTSLVPGSGAAQAGLQRGDTITEFNGELIKEYLDVTKLLSECEAGDHVEIKVNRNGKAMRFDVVMGIWE